MKGQNVDRPHRCECPMEGCRDTALLTGRLLGWLGPWAAVAGRLATLPSLHLPVEKAVLPSRMTDKQGGGAERSNHTLSAAHAHCTFLPISSGEWGFISAEKVGHQARGSRGQRDSGSPWPHQWFDSETLSEQDPMATCLGSCAH